MAYHRGPARHTKLTPQLIATIAELVIGGLSPSKAANLAGAPTATYAEWMQRSKVRCTKGRPRKPLYEEFVAAIRWAEAQFVQNQLAAIWAAAKGSQTTKTHRRKTRQDGVVVDELHSSVLVRESPFEIQRKTEPKHEPVRRSIKAFNAASQGTYVVSRTTSLPTPAHRGYHHRQPLRALCDVHYQ